MLPETVVVAGATGFVGRNLIEYMNRKVDRILPVSTSGAAVCGLAGYTLAKLAEADIGPDTILVNVAAYRYDASRFGEGQAEILLRNVELSGQIYEFCLRKRIREVRNVSSIAVYPEDEIHFDDAAVLDLARQPHQGEQMYAWSKRIGEIYGALFEQQYGINTINFRVTNPYGPHDSLDLEKAHVVPAFIIRALTTCGAFLIRGSPQATRDFIFVEDVCEVICRSLRRRGQSGSYNLCSGESVTIEMLARMVLREVGSEREIVASGAGSSTVVHRYCPNERLRADFGIESFTSLEAGLKPTIEWYRGACP